jgi:hypothetical protein
MFRRFFQIDQRQAGSRLPLGKVPVTQTLVETKVSLALAAREELVTSTGVNLFHRE